MKGLYTMKVLLSSLKSLKRVENRWHFRHRVPTLSMYEGADTPTAILETKLHVK